MKSSEIYSMCRGEYDAMFKTSISMPFGWELKDIPGWNDLANQSEIIDDLHKWRDQMNVWGAEIVLKAIQRAYHLTDDQSVWLTRYLEATI